MTKSPRQNRIPIPRRKRAKATSRRPRSACYVTNVSPVLEARFTIQPDTFSSCTIHATDGPFGGIVSTNISFSGGNSGPVRLAAGGGIGRFVDKCSYDLDWMATELEGDAFPAEEFVKTRNHVLYTIFHEPLAPWKRVPLGDSQNAWTSALDFALVTAGAGDSDNETNSLAAITQHLFSGHGLVYDTKRGATRYSDFADASFHLSGYMNLVAPTNATIVNCYDQALSLSLFGKLCGIDPRPMYMDPFGYINTQLLVGIGSCNNPFFSSSAAMSVSRTNQVEGADDPLRTHFSNHMFVSLGDRIFDACAGPACGETNCASYVTNAVDTSTTSERFYTETRELYPGVYFNVGCEGGNFHNATEDNSITTID